jgi:amino acid transporter
MKNAKDYFQIVLGVLVITGFFLLLIILVLSAIPKENEGLLNLVIGALIGSFVTVVNYFFGSSKGSAEKTELLSKKPGDTL